MKWSVFGAINVLIMILCTKRFTRNPGSKTRSTAYDDKNIRRGKTSIVKTNLNLIMTEKFSTYM
jgi:hypothetical protein